MKIQSKIEKIVIPGLIVFYSEIEKIFTWHIAITSFIKDASSSKKNDPFLFNIHE